MTRKISLGALLVLAALLTHRALADGAPPSPAAGTEESPWRLGLAFGYGQRSNPLVQSDDVPIVVDVDIAWFGERFFFDNGDLGFTVANGEFATVNAVARVNSDRLFFSRTDTKFFRVLNTSAGLTVTPTSGPGPDVFALSVPDRDYAVELGLELLADGRWGMLQLTAHHDVSGTHDGYEVFLDYARGWRHQRWYLQPSVGVAWKSNEMNDYYWGVRPREANLVLPAYQAGSGVDVHARVLASYQLTRNWAFSMAAEIVRLNDDAAGSPIVAESNVAGWFAGFGYRFR